MGDFGDFQRDRGSRFGGRDRGFDRERSFGGRGGGRDRRDMPQCDAVCAKCGKDCKVPFKPTGDKPVFCSSCFEKQGNTRSPTQSGVSQDQFAQLNRKLDKIMKALNIPEEKVVEKPIEEKKEAIEEDEDSDQEEGF